VTDRTTLLFALPGFRVLNVTLDPEGGRLVRVESSAKEAVAGSHLRMAIPHRTRTQTHGGHESSSRMARVGTSERRRRSPSGLGSRASVACAVEQVADPEVERIRIRLL
jgi:hypothetical protein